MSQPGDVDLRAEVSKGLVAKFGMAALGFIGTVIFARLLGPVAFGGYYLILSVVKIADRFSTGMSTASKKRFSETDSPKREILGAQLLISLATALVIGVAAFALGHQFRTFTGVEAAPILLVALAVPLFLFTGLQNILTGTGRVSLPTWIDGFRSLLTLPLQLVLVLIGLGVAGMAFGLSIATALGSFLSLYYIGLIPVAPSRSSIQSLWRFGKFSIVNSLIGRLYSRYDILLLGLLVGAGASGRYEVALQLTLPAAFVAELAGSGLMASVSNLRSRGLRIERKINNTQSFATVLTVPVFFGAVVLSEPLVVTIYGGQYRSAAPLLIGLALYQVFRSRVTILGEILNALDKPNSITLVGGVGLCVNIVIGYALTVAYGPVGVVVATVLVEAMMFVLYSRILRNAVEGVVVFPRQLAFQIISGAIMYMVVFFLYQRIDISSVIYLGGIVGIGATVYFTILTLLSSQFRNAIFPVIDAVREGCKNFLH